MKNRFKNTCLSLVAVIAMFSCCSQAATETEQSNQPEAKWEVSHKADGATRFEFNTDQQNYYYELKLLGFETDGEFVAFESPQMINKTGRVTKQWAPYLQEIWLNNYLGQKVLTLQIDSPKFNHENVSQLKLKYNVNSNFQGWLTVDGNYSESNPVKSQLRTHTYTAQVAAKKDQVILALHQEVFHQGKHRDQIKVIEQDKSGRWSHQFITGNDLNNTACDLESDGFVESLAVEGNWLVIGNSNDCEDKVDSGALFVFQKKSKGWQFHSKLKTKEIYSDGWYGEEVSIHDGVIYTSSNNNYLQQIHIFKLVENEWQEQSGIMVNGRSQASGSMSQFKVHGNLLVIGMRGFLDPEYFTHQSGGEVLVYRKKNAVWELESRLKPHLAQGDDGFGSSVAVGDGVIAVSAPDLISLNKNQPQGAVHVFEYETGAWQNTQAIRPAVESLEVNNVREWTMNGLEISENDLYIQNNYLLYPTNRMSDLPQVCAFADGRGAIHHYKKQDKNWQLSNSIKLQENPGYLGEALSASEHGLYFLSNESTVENQDSSFLNFYKKGQIKWKKLISELP